MQLIQLSTMTKVEILIPSHINYEGQIDLLDKCISSLLEQRLKPKSIYISISFENDIYKTDFKSILQKYGRTTNPKINFKISKEKKYQMEHLHNISSNIDVNDYDMLMFCDDDDTYHQERVSTFVAAFNYGKDNSSENFGGVREYINDNMSPEYWCYGIVPCVIVEFFSFFKGVNYRLIQHNFGDMYLRYYLCINTTKYSNWIGIRPALPLYNYNNNNQNSICGKIERGMGNKEDNLLLFVLYCRSDSEFDKFIQENKKLYNIDYKTKEVLIYIYNFCKIFI